MAKHQPNSQPHQPSAPVPLKKERDAETELRNRMEDVICINN
jgi:hypothetical protein